MKRQFITNNILKRDWENIYKNIIILWQEQNISELIQEMFFFKIYVPIVIL